MRRILLVVVIAVMLVAAAVLWRAPAALIEMPLDRLAGERIGLVDTEGTVWRGSGTLVAGDLRIPMAWSAHPTALLHREVAITLMPAQAGTQWPTGDVVLGNGQTRLRNVVLQIPAAVIASALFPRPPLTASGIVELATAELDWVPDAGAGGLSATWRSASLGIAGGVPIALGEVSAQLRMSDGVLSGPVRNAGGEFAIDGELVIRARGGGSLRGVVQARRADDPRIDALRALGRPQGGGVQLEWRWPSP